MKISIMEVSTQKGFFAFTGAWKTWYIEPYILFSDWLNFLSDYGKEFPHYLLRKWSKSLFYYSEETPSSRQLL